MLLPNHRLTSEWLLAYVRLYFCSEPSLRLSQTPSMSVFVMKVGQIIHKTTVLLTLLLLASCVSKAPTGQSIVSNTVAIVAVTAAPGVKSGQSASVMARELKEFIHEAGGYRTLRSSQVEQAMNASRAGSYRELVGSFARDGVVGPSELRSLNAASLPVQLALIARVEQNDIKKDNFQVEPLRNHTGVLLTDRERKILITEREVQMRASLINVSSGAVVWSRTYRSIPQTKLSYVHYLGSSFSGTLAASLVNTMTTGLREPDWPAPASYQITVQSLMREVARNLPR